MQWTGWFRESRPTTRNKGLGRGPWRVVAQAETFTACRAALEAYAAGRTCDLAVMLTGAHPARWPGPRRDSIQERPAARRLRKEA